MWPCRTSCLIALGLMLLPAAIEEVIGTTAPIPFPSLLLQATLQPTTSTCCASITSSPSMAWDYSSFPTNPPSAMMVTQSMSPILFKSSGGFWIQLSQTLLGMIGVGPQNIGTPLGLYRATGECRPMNATAAPSAISTTTTPTTSNVTDQAFMCGAPQTKASGIEQIDGVYGSTATPSSFGSSSLVRYLIENSSQLYIPCAMQSIPKLCICGGQSFAPSQAPSGRPTFKPTARSPSNTPTTSKPSRTPSQTPSKSPSTTYTYWQLVVAPSTYNITQLGGSSENASNNICASTFGLRPDGIPRRAVAFLSQSSEQQIGVPFTTSPFWSSLVRSQDRLFSTNLMMTNVTASWFNLINQSLTSQEWQNLDVGGAYQYANFANPNLTIPLVLNLDPAGFTSNLTQALVPPNPFWFGMSYWLDTDRSCNGWTNSTSASSASLLLCSTRACAMTGAQFCCTVRTRVGACMNSYKLLCLVEAPFTFVPTLGRLARAFLTV